MQVPIYDFDIKNNATFPRFYILIFRVGARNCKKIKVVCQVRWWGTSKGHGKCTALSYRPIAPWHARHLCGGKRRRHGSGTLRRARDEWGRSVVVLAGPRWGLRYRITHLPVGKRRRVLRGNDHHHVVRSPPLVKAKR